MTCPWRPWMWIPAAFGALGIACGDTTTTGVPELNLDRPVDVSFACYGNMKLTSNGQIIQSAVPTFACQQLSPPLTDAKNPAAPVPGQENLPADPAWYAFILQSASGTVAIATWPAAPADTLASDASPLQVSDTFSSVFKVLDADPSTPGKNAIGIGEDPVAIATDKAGCFEVTANAGSCDLSELDINSALGGLSIDGAPAVSGSKPRVDRVNVTTPNGTRILARPGAMIAEPGTQIVGNACAHTATGQLYITYPSCHLVAEVQLGADAMGGASATLIGGIQYDDTGTPKVLAAADLEAVGMSCPTECPPAKGAPVPVTPGVRPVALDHKLDPRTDNFGLKPNVTSRLAIGSDITDKRTAAPLLVVDLDLTTFAPVATTLLPIALEADSGPVGVTALAVGVTALAISPQIGMGGDAHGGSGTVDDNTNDQAQYVYAVATDGTVRVADVLTQKRECDTQIDGRFLRNIVGSSLECLPLGRPDLPRRSGARSPGIELPGTAVPSSVAIVKGLTSRPVLTRDTAGNPLTFADPAPPILLGYFAVITASTGVVYVANIDDDYAPDQVNPTPGNALSTSAVLVMSHQLRDSLTLRDDPPKDCKTADGVAGASSGGPRLSTPPAQQFAANTLSPDLDAELPRLQQVACTVDSTIPITVMELGAPEVNSDVRQGPAASRDAVFPDLKSVTSENWTLTYEGALASDTTLNGINGPTVRSGQAFVDRDGMVLADAARPFCDMGIEPGDIVDLDGCNPANGDGDCPADYTCYVHPRSTIGVGACLLRSEASRLADACRDFLTTSRHYTVGTGASGRTTAGKLILLQRKHELSTTPVDGCVSDDQCNDLARAAVVINHSADSTTNAQWSCQADPLRPPINRDNPAQNKRCVQICTPPQNPNDALPAPLCGNGAVCMADPGSVTGGVCMEGVEPPQVCLNGPQRYTVRAAEAFTVIGDRSGFVHPIITDTDGSCKVDPNLAKNPLQHGRIPLKAPACDPTPADRFTGLIGNTNTFEANPCSLTVSQYEYGPTYPGPDANGGPLAFGSCTVPVIATTADVRSTVPAIKFRNRAMTLTLVDPYRPAAQSCLGRDPAGVPTHVPLVVPGYQIALDVKAGYAPFTLSLVGQVSPIKVVRGPTDSIWVVDDGDFLASNITQASTRGKVFRIEAVNTTFVNTME